jgi:RHS repeat-associated protein
VFQRDGKGQETRQLYDLLGRLSERREYPGAELGTGPGVVANGTLWTYDACNVVATGNGAAGRGKLCRMETHAVFPYSESNLVHRQERAYDGAARAAMTTTTVGSTVYVSGAQYDSNGRISQLEYPSGLVVKQSYSGWNGQLAAVTDAVGIAYWQATSRNTDGQIASMRVGPHTTSKTYDPLGRVATIATPGLQSATYAFDELGNLTSRADPVLGQPAETYSYDLVNRLVSANGSIIASYDATGNITWRSDVGNYSYYHGTHRLQSAGSQFYDYDANGTLTSGGGRTVISTAFNMPQRITAGSNIIDFSYDGDHARTAEFGSVSGFTFLVGSQFYEEQFKPDGTLVRRHYITTPEGVVALVQQRAAGPAVTSTIRYWHKDHLGSVVAISNEQAQTVERVTFGVWGRRANPFLPAGEPLEERGYTGHETLDDVAVTNTGLVHMNGRIYDPATGRFLSADPMVQDPFNAQSYNRYSYVLNNPLSFTDPTGFSWWTRWRRTIFAAVAAIATYGATSLLITNPALETAGGSTVLAAVADFQYGATVAVLTPAGSAVAGAAAGFAAGGIMGGNIESALTGALAGGLSGVVAGYYGATYSVTRVGVEGLVGGINSRIQGGRFLAGLESGLLFSALTYATATTRAEMVKFASTVPGNVGYSPGAFGIAGRIGGELINADEWTRVNGVPFDPSDPNYDAYLQKYWEKVKGGPFGGVQGRNPGTLFGIPYPPGGLADRLVESFAGFHDWLNKIPFYNFDPASPLYGTSHDFLDGGVLAHYLGETVSAVNVLLAAPVVGAAITPEYLRSVLLSDYRKGAR